MKKTIILSLLSVSVATAGYATTLSSSGAGKLAAVPMALEKKNTTDFNVRITLVDIYGNPLSGSSGLRGFWARNEATGEYFYPGGREDEDKFEALPSGTYTFGAYPGAWDGAVQKTVTLSSSEVGPDGYIVVQLTYWVE
ncbi:hypothetical protein [Pedobacter caeni]|uniref:DUF2141 domain-containing protein n=1 Tax=Pedobacter caeni TaxID=288992 RepID=A0A1M4U8N7_9SPHI|nr:hypothetical protein [Pedobacter caeni]SHE53129.1 hypothetical protein SAMN04488522_101471 [Pedobacter caeni]